MENSGKKKTPICAGDIGTLNPNTEGVTEQDSAASSLDYCETTACEMDPSLMRST